MFGLPFGHLRWRQPLLQVVQPTVEQHTYGRFAAAHHAGDLAGRQSAKEAQGQRFGPIRRQSLQRGSHAFETQPAADVLVNGRARIGQLLELVGLAERAGDRYGSYSLGMKQRLGIAAALLPDPALLVLDEPANGLDPAGIIEVRSLLRDLADDGTTVFVSSHQLSEVEQISDWLVMIDHGRLLYDGPIDQILDRQQAELVVATEQPGDLGTVARLAAEAGHYSTPANGHLLRIQAPASYAATLNRQAMEHDVTLVELHHEQPSLEETFLSMTTTTEAQS